MPNIYVLDESKNLKCTQAAKNYVGENNAETISILLPSNFNGLDIKNCYIEMEFDSNIPEKYPNLKSDMYQNYLVYQLPLDKTFTNKARAIKFRIHIKNVNLKITTNWCSFQIIDK